MACGKSELGREIMGKPAGGMGLVAAAVNIAGSLCLSFCMSKLYYIKYSLFRGNAKVSLKDTEGIK